MTSQTGVTITPNPKQNYLMDAQFLIELEYGGINDPQT